MATIEQAIIRDYPRLSLDDPITFQCDRALDCFTLCCRDVSIVLTPYDVARLKKALGIDSSEFLDQYTISPFTRDQKFPVVLLRMDPATKKCPFVTETGCSVYANRPWACRMYPLGVAEPRNATAADRTFHFLLREDTCHGHGVGRTRTVRECLAEQGLEEYEAMNASFKELMLHEFWDQEEALAPEKLDMYYMACFDLDRFRRFVFETRLLELFEIDEARVEAVRTDDAELLDLAMQWLRFALFREKTMKIKPSVAGAKRREMAGEINGTQMNADQRRSD